MGLSTHMLDTARGLPARGVALTLWRGAEAGWEELGRGITDEDGRCRSLLGDGALEAGTYRLRFEVKPYFEAMGLRPLYPFVEIVFEVTDPAQHHHIPLLATANGYTTYRGS